MGNISVTKKLVIDLTEGVVENVVDFAILMSLLGIDILTMANSPRRYPSGYDTPLMELIDEVNYRSIKNAVYQATKRGWVSRSPKGAGKIVNITEAGRKRLEAKIPFYDHERVWDEVLYLITYDISEEQKKDRDRFRIYLRKIGCGLLQKSVWITPYNPRYVLQEFIREKNLQAAIIVSSLGKDGSIGNKNLPELVSEVYTLAKLNKKYSAYIDKFHDNTLDPL